MIPKIKLLFIGAPDRATIENQKLLNSNLLPLAGHFEENFKEAIAYLEDCAAMNFPDVLILDEQLGAERIKSFLSYYRRNFYIRQSDALLFVAGHGSDEEGLLAFSPILASRLSKPLNKSVFLKEIYPLISFTMV